ncbi:uncharacterized protein LOC114757620 [Neltuma alba]|uniref:uncharacterized protein LOC114757620 n=1 Tax=Neltuma alba TaxID=207710 RepID=UPI0010A57D53|nr:uncharacterized protein LOC114757620 [Prosopis alba]
MDAGFIIEVFIMSHQKDHGDDAKLTQHWLVSSILQDLCLLENKLPFFVIEELFNRAFPDECRGHILEIPQFLVDDSTELVFCNMITLEECHYPYAACITDYALVLDCLIDTQKDVHLLVHKKILCSYLGDTDDVALLFNGLLGNVNQLAFSTKYIDICQRLNGYCEDHWHKLWATLRHDYCHTPCQTVTSIAAMILILLTVVQTIFSILQFVK